MQPGAACAEMLLVGWGCENFVLNVNANSNVIMVEWLCTGPLPSACGVVWFGAGAPNHTQIVALAPPNQIKSNRGAGAPNQNHSWRWRRQIMARIMIFIYS